ncbi:uncharacterized protein LOC134530444 [Bacillus rossius redtenbacheri]|uniref:uncharacterized protein LOC134530444 n=1 Tax=Bacillus rossius redtenbacheri TaxID=93214 RepID=UPI002FDDC927
MAAARLALLVAALALAAAGEHQTSQVVLEVWPGVDLRLSLAGDSLLVGLQLHPEEVARKKSESFGLMPFMMMGPMISLGLFPFMFANLNMMVMKAVMMNNMVLGMALFNTIRDVVFGPNPGRKVVYANYGYRRPRPPIRETHWSTQHDLHTSASSHKDHKSTGTLFRNNFPHGTRLVSPQYLVSPAPKEEIHQPQKSPHVSDHVPFSSQEELQKFFVANEAISGTNDHVVNLLAPPPVVPEDNQHYEQLNFGDQNAMTFPEESVISSYAASVPENVFAGAEVTSSVQDSTHGNSHQHDPTVVNREGQREDSFSGQSPESLYVASGQGRIFAGDKGTSSDQDISHGSPHKFVHQTIPQEDHQLHGYFRVSD